MKEIKFRFWNKECKCMEDCYFISGDGRIYRENISADTPNTDIIPVDNVIPLQYAGIKDENGK